MMVSNDGIVNYDADQRLGVQQPTGERNILKPLHTLFFHVETFNTLLYIKPRLMHRS